MRVWYEPLESRLDYLSNGIKYDTIKPQHTADLHLNLQIMILNKFLHL